MQIPRFWWLALMATIAFLVPATAQAKKDPIAQAFKGKILVTTEELPPPDLENPQATIKEFKAAHKGVVTAKSGTFSFHITAFTKTKPASDTVALEFYTDDKEKLFVADKRLTGLDPTVQIVTTFIQLGEDDNLNPNRKYVLKLVSYKGKKSTVLAETKLATK